MRKNIKRIFQRTINKINNISQIIGLNIDKILILLMIAIGDNPKVIQRILTSLSNYIVFRDFVLLNHPCRIELVDAN